MRSILTWATIIAVLVGGRSLYAIDTDFGDAAARATDDLAIDLLRQFAKNTDNLCLSPYSIQSALAMTFAGADGETRAEMARVLHYSAPNESIQYSFRGLRWSLDEIAKKTAQIAEQSKKSGGPSEPVTLAVANRLFAQSGYDFRVSFQSFVKEIYGAPFESLDFKRNPEAARTHINRWVADQTRDKIRDLIPRGGIRELTRLVLANAVYLKAPWATDFQPGLTKLKSFHTRDGATVEVPMMEQQKQFGYEKHEHFTAVAIPYSGGELQFLVLLPDEMNGLADLESGLNAGVLKNCAKLSPELVDIELPRFKIAPPTIPLKENLEALGMKSAFDDPRGSANFDKMSPRSPERYLAISDVFHKTCITVDERGTEAAAATAVVVMELTARLEKPEPIHVKVDRPFLYAIQHVPTGACLFVGRVIDPR